MTRFRRVFFPTALLLAAGAFILSSLQSAFSQSGRGPQPDPKERKTDKRKNPGPTPKIRLPENPPQKSGEDSGDIIRINSDLVNVVVTVGGRPLNASLDLKPEDFEILEDGAPQEGAAVFSVSTDVVVLQEFTNKIPLLVDATRQLKAQGATSLYDAIYLASDYLKPAEGRRVIVIVSDGGDTTSGKGLLESLARAQKSDSVIFAIFTGNPWPSENLRDLAAERALESLTKETGGELFKPRLSDGRRPGEESDEASLKELDRTFTDLAERLRTQYVLGFYSSNEKRDGSFRKLDVRIKKPNYAARARTGYYAPKE